MNASSHNPLSVLARVAAKHHGTKAATPTSAKPASGRRHERGLLLVLLVAQLMVILDITAVNIALPSLAKDLQLSGSDISWTITSYSLVFGSLLLLGGRAADLLGRRRVFTFGVVLFTLASAASRVRCARLSQGSMTTS